CGSVRYEISGKLSPIQYCHAQRCRKASGAAFATEAAARVVDFAFTQGQELISSYDAPLLREPPAYRRNFCRQCGSPLPVPLEGTDYVVVQAGTLDGDVPAKVFRHIFTGQRAPWYEINDELPKFEARPPVHTRLPETKSDS
ncbi:MAG: hypothetical protein ACI9QQ_002522, partial [Myxococcota bacterium]